MAYCCMNVIVLFAIQYSTRPLAKPPSMNMKTQGIQAKIIFCVASVGAGFSFCCNHMEMPSTIGMTPIKTSARIESGSGAPHGSRPNRLYIVEVSGALKSLIQPIHGACRSSIVTKITL